MTTTTDQDKPAHYEVGQALYFEWNEYCYPVSRRLTGEMVTIKKVGRKWLELSNGYRVDKARLLADGKGFTPQAQCFISKEDRLLVLETKAAWLTLSDHINNYRPNPPKGITLENIQKSLALLTPSSENDYDK